MSTDAFDNPATRVDEEQAQLLTGVPARKWLDRVTFHHTDPSHPAVNGLKLLAAGRISLSKACEWLSAFFETGVEEPIAAMDHKYPDEMFESPGDFYLESMELRRLFALQATRTQEAVEVWRAENPGNELILPDLGNLLTWLLEERRRLLAKAILIHEPQRRIDMIDSFTEPPLNWAPPIGEPHHHHHHHPEKHQIGVKAFERWEQAGRPWLNPELTDALWYSAEWELIQEFEAREFEARE